MLDKIIDKIFGNAGGITKNERIDQFYRHKFSNYLPWIAYDEKTNVYLNFDDTVRFMWECVPLCFANDSVSESLEGLFKYRYSRRFCYAVYIICQ